MGWDYGRDVLCRNSPPSDEEDFDELMRERGYYSDEYGEITEDELLDYFEAREDSVQVCSRLFKNNNKEEGEEKNGEKEEEKCGDEGYDNFKILNKNAICELKNKGFTYIDNILGEEDMQTIYEACMKRVEDKKLLPAKEAAHNDPHHDWTVRGDLIEFLHEGNYGDDYFMNNDATFLPIKSMFDDLTSELHQIIRLNGNMIERQLAYYPPNNIGYHRHRDALPDGGDNNFADFQYFPRRITAIIYINDVHTKWQADHGGCLRIYLKARDPFRSRDSENDDDKEGEFVDIEPIAGRMVIFLSGAIDHKVLPILNHHRLAITSWYH